MTIETTTRDTGRRFYAALDAQDWPLVTSLVHPELTVQVGSHAPKTYEQWRENLAAIYVGFPDGRHVIEQELVDGAYFVTSCRFEGGHAGAFLDHAATGRRVSARVIHIDRVEDGRITAHQGQLDMFGLLQQLQ